jgi:hypothetical protein
MTGSWVILSIIAGALVVSGVSGLWPRSPHAQFRRLYALWSADARHRGLSSEQMDQEFQFRHAWAALRRRASHAAVEHPGHYREKLAEIAAEEAVTLSLVDRGVAKRFLGVVDSVPLCHILYPDALDAVYRERPVMPPVDITEDTLAALRHS